MQQPIEPTAERGMELRSAIEQLLAQIPVDFGGGCSASKGYLMAVLIRELHAPASVDIGVYRGRSLFPQALAHRRYTGGVAYGVDPWSKDEARQKDTSWRRGEIDNFIDRTDFEAIYGDVVRMRSAAALQAHCKLMRMTSRAAAEQFRAQGTMFGLVHIDGNHDTATVSQDVRDFEPLLVPGGILVLDDVSWDSVRPAHDALISTMPKLFQRIDATNDYAVFWKVSTVPGKAPHWHRLFSKDYVING